MVALNLHFCNTTLTQESTDNETKSYGSLTFHQLGLIISAATGLIATVLSFYLMFMHATHYSRPSEQRHILRILFMIPIYSVVSFLSFYFYHHYVYYQVIRDCYDAFAIASFFSLLCNYIAPDLHSQKDYFRKLTPKNWLLPLSWFQRCCGSERKGPWRVPRSGLTWFNIMWVFIFQYCLLRVVLTIVAVVTEYFGRYCVEGLSPAYFHVWGTVISAVSVSLAMYCLIQFYYQIRQDIATHSPFIKILSIKLVIFFVFWQTIILSFLNDAGVIRASEKIAQPDITIGIPAILIDIEMAVFAVLHIFAYPWKAYDLKRSGGIAEVGGGPGFDKEGYQGGALGFKAYLDAFNPWDIIKAIGRGFKWAIVGRRSREEDISYKNGLGATPLQDAIPGRSGKYEQLNDAGIDDEEHASYDAFSGPFTGSTSKPAYSHDQHPPQNTHYDSHTMKPAQVHDADGFTHVAPHAELPGTAHSGFEQDTSYHAVSHPPTSGYTPYRPDPSRIEESQYYDSQTHAR